MLAFIARDGLLERFAEHTPESWCKLTELGTLAVRCSADVDDGDVRSGAHTSPHLALTSPHLAHTSPHLARSLARTSHTPRPTSLRFTSRS